MPQSYTKSGVTVKTGANLDVLGTVLQTHQIKAAASVVNKAIDCLGSTHRKLRYAWLYPDVLKYARRYFLFGPHGPSVGQRNHMLAILVLTRNGLTGERTVVIDEHGLNPDAMGWTSAIHVPNNEVANQQAQFPERRFYPDATAQDHIMYGEINVADKLLVGPRKQGVMTFIHEATHRYANTLDFGEEGYSTDGVNFNQAGLTNAMALQNAESYGWFAYKVGR